MIIIIVLKTETKVFTGAIEWAVNVDYSLKYVVIVVVISFGYKL